MPVASADFGEFSVDIVRRKTLNKIISWRAVKNFLKKKQKPGMKQS